MSGRQRLSDDEIAALRPAYEDHLLRHRILNAKARLRRRGLSQRLQRDLPVLLLARLEAEPAERGVDTSGARIRARTVCSGLAWRRSLGTARSSSCARQSLPQRAQARRWATSKLSSRRPCAPSSREGMAVRWNLDDRDGYASQRWSAGTAGTVRSGSCQGATLRRPTRLALRARTSRPLAARAGCAQPVAVERLACLAACRSVCADVAPPRASRPPDWLRAVEDSALGVARGRHSLSGADAVVGGCWRGHHGPTGRRHGERRTVLRLGTRRCCSERPRTGRATCSDELPA